MKIVQSMSTSFPPSPSFSLFLHGFFYFNFSLVHEPYRKVYIVITAAYWGGLQEL